MYGIDILVEEHDYILKAIGAIRKSCKEVLSTNKVDTETFYKYLDFARNYADKHHHGKEELILFKIMVDNLPPVAEKLIRNGMLVEHDMGRLHLAQLEEALKAYDDGDHSEEVLLSVIANAIGYCQLLERHIGKENEVVYPFGDRELSDDLREQVNVETKVFEKDNHSIKTKYETWIDSLQ